LGIEAEPAPTSSGPSTEPLLANPNLKHWQVPETGATASISPKEGAIGPPPTGRESPLAQPVIYQVASATPGPTAPSPPITVTGNDRVMINFVGADVHEVISSVLSDTLKVNYSIDPKVQGTVAFRTMSPILKSDLLGLLEDMLALAGAAMVPAITSFLSTRPPRCRRSSRASAAASASTPASASTSSPCISPRRTR
jgi:hypothetical protein